MDPASGYDPASWIIFNNIFQSLLTFPVGAVEPQPELAESCSFTDKETRVYQCRIKEGAEFSNGEKLDASDVKFSFDRTLAINDPGGPAVMFESLRSVQTPDDRTVVFHLKSPDATFPSKIASGAGSIVSKTDYSPFELKRDEGAVGSGPYTLTSLDEDGATFSTNENYKGDAEVKSGKIELTSFHGDSASLKKALTDGRVDVAYRGLNARDLTELMAREESEELDVIEGNGVEVKHLVFNITDPVTGSMGVRKAIAHLLDREELTAAIHKDTTVPLYSLVPTGIEGHDTAFFDKYGARPSANAAKEALEAAGVTKKVKLTLWSTPTRYGPSTDDELILISEQLNRSGLFETNVKSVEYEQYQRDISAGKYGIYVKGWIPDYPDPENFTKPFFGPENILRNNYENDEVTGHILPAVAASPDRSATQTDFAHLHRIVANEVPLLPLWQSKQHLVVQKNIRGSQHSLDASTIFRLWALYRAT
ncbi:ABC transporter substrate-binding protein [Streptomyces sp. NPDC000349]|uniref:ABC transporter substrate-binding protein n=1 Tax=Streptomyces sp. NPDC000349 TaxID=3154249 RepID=UPI0027807D0F|nr:ABC transporter substrate-binding protein [Streptomyces sp. DSM 40167]MDQ0408772.1 peptide/nickel transport system substrate-binding protein [Streptomyces sp. DSM 40167]